MFKRPTTLNQALKRARKAGITQKQIAAFMGVSEGRITQMKNGERYRSTVPEKPKSIQRLIDAIGDLLEEIHGKEA